MIKFLIKRSLVSSAPWAFNQHKFPNHLEELKDDRLALKFIHHMEPGYKYAFESILNSFCSQDLETLNNCLEPSLFTFVSKRLSDLNSNNMEFRRINHKPLLFIPISFNMHVGVRTNRQLNPKKADTQPINPLDSKLMSMMIGYSFPKDQQIFLKNIRAYSLNPFIMNYSVISVEIAFFGEPVLGLFKENLQLNKASKEKEYHFLKFETEIYIENMKQITENPLLALEVIESIKWSVSDIDNQLNGNSFFK